MTDKKLTQLTSASAMSTNDVLLISQNTGTVPDSKKITIGTFFSSLPTYATILFGGDTNLFRDQANVLKTDDNFAVGATLYCMNSIIFGVASDTNLYRSGSNVLRTDDSLSAGQLTVDNDVNGVAGSTITYVYGWSNSISTGTGTVKMCGATSRNSNAWVKIYIGTTAYYYPVWSTITG